MLMLALLYVVSWLAIVAGSAACILIVYDTAGPRARSFLLAFTTGVLALVLMGVRP